MDINLGALIRHVILEEVSQDSSHVVYRQISINQSELFAQVAIQQILRSLHRPREAVQKHLRTFFALRDLTNAVPRTKVTKELVEKHKGKSIKIIDSEEEASVKTERGTNHPHRSLASHVAEVMTSEEESLVDRAVRDVALSLEEMARTQEKGAEEKTHVEAHDVGETHRASSADKGKYRGGGSAFVTQISAATVSSKRMQQQQKAAEEATQERDHNKRLFEEKEEDFQKIQKKVAKTELERTNLQAQNLEDDNLKNSIS